MPNSKNLEVFVTANMQRDQMDSNGCEKYVTPLLMNNGAQLYLAKPHPEDCECDIHGLEINQARYKQLANKERRLHNELTKINREMIDLTTLMLSSPCNADKTMRSVYKTDYEKRSLPVTEYRPLMVAIDSPIQTSIKLAKLDLKDTYKDPVRFKYSAMESPIQPAKTMADLKVPDLCPVWDEPFADCSEYMDTISRTGMINLKNQQLYLRPLVPSRKFGDCNLSEST